MAGHKGGGMVPRETFSAQTGVNTGMGLPSYCHERHLLTFLGRTYGVIKVYSGCNSQIGRKKPDSPESEIFFYQGPRASIGVRSYARVRGYDLVEV